VASSSPSSILLGIDAAAFLIWLRSYNLLKRKIIRNTCFIFLPCSLFRRQGNLDFHSIPHFGNKSEMEKVWCGSRGKAMKRACLYLHYSL